MSASWIAENLHCSRNCGRKCSTCLFANDCRNFSNGVACGAPPVRQVEHENCQVENCAECELFRLCNIQVLGQNYRKECNHDRDWTKSDKIYFPRVFTALAKLPCKHCTTCVICKFGHTLRFFDMYSQCDHVKFEKSLDRKHFCTVKDCRHCAMVLEDDLEHLSDRYRRTLDPY
jgi:hypothetical protein